MKSALQEHQADGREASRRPALTLPFTDVVSVCYSASTAPGTMPVPQNLQTRVSCQTVVMTGF